jgi:hypothetical protein
VEVLTVKKQELYIVTIAHQKGRRDCLESEATTEYYNVCFAYFNILCITCKIFCTYI